MLNDFISDEYGQKSNADGGWKTHNDEHISGRKSDYQREFVEPLDAASEELRKELQRILAGIRVA